MERRKAIIFAAAFVLAATLGTARPAGAQRQSLALDVVSLNNSGITGAGMLTSMGDGKLRAEIRVNGAGAGPEPMHIHAGTCRDLNPQPEVPLSDVVNGSSTTELNRSLQELTSTPHAIFLHKSPAEIAVLVACADVTLASQLTAVPSSGEADPWVDVAMRLSAVGLGLAAVGYALRRQAGRARASTRR